MTNYKSVNIESDRERPDLIAAYRPTRKTIQVVRAVHGLKRSIATNVVAPYGSGKSLAALVGITLLAGSPSLAEILRKRIAVIDPSLAANNSNGKTLVLLLHGSTPNLADDLARLAGVETGLLKKVLVGVLRRARQERASRIAIVWDEFGQHLETLVRQGRPEDLLAVQDLAEWVVRQSDPLVTLTTLMHQGVYHYTRRAPQSAQHAWQKIEGRFDTVFLADDAADILEILAEKLAGKRATPSAEAISLARAAGFFKEVTEDVRLAKIISNTAPLTPAALEILPRIAAQVAQAERSIFRYVAEVVVLSEPGTSLGVDNLYDYFEPAMRVDRGPGGTHRRLIEAESALSRAENDLERKIIKTAALLQIGPSTERVKLALSRLVYAVAEGTDERSEVVEATIEKLVARKVLLHRRRIDDVAVWHGADIDLGQLISDEASKLGREIDIAATLEQKFPPDAYLAPSYNYDRGITRFARARFVSEGELLSESGFDSLRLQAEVEDALVALVIDSTLDRLEILERSRSFPPHLILAIPVESNDFTPILLDLLAIEALLDREELLMSDPLVERELKELKSEAESALRKSLEGLMNPDRGEVVWISGSTLYFFSSGCSAGQILSRLFDDRFADTPFIANEQVVRRKVSAVTRSARKRCMLAIIERTGLPMLGYDGATSADASIYRTVLEHTGLYALVDGSWRWRMPSEIEDQGMRKVWSEIERFFSQPSDYPKSVDSLIDWLTAPPIGLREGVIPLLLTAGMVAFGTALALRETVNGRPVYADDVQPSLIEKMCEYPKQFTLNVHNLSDEQSRNIITLIKCMVPATDRQERDLLRSFYDALLDWRTRLPASALHTSGLDERLEMLQPYLRKKTFDPSGLLFDELPSLLGEPVLSTETVNVFRSAIYQAESVSSVLADRAVEATLNIFSRRTSGDARTVIESASKWADGIPLRDEDLRTLDHEARGILSRARSAKNTTTGARGFVSQLSGIILGKGLEAWDDQTVVLFCSRLEEVIGRVEDAVFELADDSDEFQYFLRNRLSLFLNRFDTKLGREQLIKYLEELYNLSL